jgi:hypothetical protein
MLEDFAVVDRKTKHRIPSLEAALALTYWSMKSFFSSREKKEEDATIFRSLARANLNQINRDKLRRLGHKICSGKEILQFVKIALSDERLPFDG